MVPVATPLPLDTFIPVSDVRERFETIVRAPASIVMDTAVGFDMQSIAVIRGIFWLRDRLMRTKHTSRTPRGLLDETRALGWELLCEDRDRLVICGAACQPWLGDVTFLPIAADAFAAYATPGQVKIAWSLEATALGPSATRFAHETRVVATDAEARRKFLAYWRWARFGIVAIRLLLLPAIRRQAEQRQADHLACAG